MVQIKKILLMILGHVRRVDERGSAMSKLGGGTKIYAQMEHCGSNNGLTGRIEGVMAGNKKLQDEAGVVLPATDLQREPERVETWQPATWAHMSPNSATT